MNLEMLHGKIHRANVTQAELNYVGSITVDKDLLEAAGIYEYQKVQIVDIDNGQRFEIGQRNNLSQRSSCQMCVGRR